MSRYDIKAMGGRGRSAECLPREGMVDEVCREWTVHEDKALAYRLQNEEYTHHLGVNKERNAMLRQDTPHAKNEQYKADEEAARAQYKMELEIVRQEARDAAIASAISDQLEKQELEERRLREMRDFEFAKKVAAGEKSKLRRKKELKQVEREAAYLGINAGLDNVALLTRKDKRNRQLNSSEETAFRRSARPSSNDFSDLSDFCIKPDPSMDEEDVRQLQEQQDEELALLLQEQDLKRRGDLLQKDQLSVMEAQDKELAKVLQEQEKAKAKKAREKARQKSLLKHQPPEQQHQASIRHHSPSEPRQILNTSNRSSSPDQQQFESPQYATISSTRAPPSVSHQMRPNSPQYATPEIVCHNRVTSNASSNSPDERNSPSTKDNNESPKNKSNFSSKGRGEVSPPSKGAVALSEDNKFPHRGRLDPVVMKSNKSPQYPSQPSSAFPNIACAIDPTYERRVRQGELSPYASTPPLGADSSSSNNCYANISSNHEPPLTSPNSKSAVRTLVYSSNDEAIETCGDGDNEGEEDYLPPPYMPIQGQRRTASLEKRERKRNLLKQSPKEAEKSGGGCKQQ